MPGPIIGTQGFDNPPEEIRAALGDNAYQYHVMVHRVLFGVPNQAQGILDGTNIIGDLTDTLDHSLFTNVLPYQHHGTDAHADLTQAAAVAGGTFSSVSVTSASAGVTYTAAEQTLINEMKADINTIATGLVSVGNAVNNIISALRNAGLMA
jgi:hypothetical protein